MADRAYARLLDDLAENRFQMVSLELRSNILAYYRDTSAPNAVKKKTKRWTRVTKELEDLKTSAPPQIRTSIEDAN